jgi:hypothetical protein
MNSPEETSMGPAPEYEADAAADRNRVMSPDPRQDLPGGPITDPPQLSQRGGPGR